MFHCLVSRFISSVPPEKSLAAVLGELNFQLALSSDHAVISIRCPLVQKRWGGEFLVVEAMVGM